MRSPVERHSEEAEQVVRDIRRAARRQYSAEEKVRIVIAGLWGEESIVELCRKERINQNLYYRWSKEFLEAVVSVNVILTRDRQGKPDPSGCEVLLIGGPRARARRRTRRLPRLRSKFLSARPNGNKDARMEGGPRKTKGWSANPS